MMHSHHFGARRSRPGGPGVDAGFMGARVRGDDGAILVEYGMVLVAVLIVSFALVQFIGGRVVEMFEFVIPGFG